MTQGSISQQQLNLHSLAFLSCSVEVHQLFRLNKLRGLANLHDRSLHCFWAPGIIFLLALHPLISCRSFEGVSKYSAIYWCHGVFWTHWSWVLVEASKVTWTERGKKHVSFIRTMTQLLFPLVMGHRKCLCLANADTLSKQRRRICSSQILIGVHLAAV